MVHCNTVKLPSPYQLEAEPALWHCRKNVCKLVLGQL